MQILSYFSIIYCDHSYPIGATGGSQVRTIVLQLRGEAGQMQVKDPEIGLVHNIGGVGIYGNVTILSNQ